MIAKISDSLLSQLGDFIADRLGLHFPRQRWLELRRAAQGAAQECGCGQDLDAYVRGVLLSAAHHNHLGFLASHLTVGETYFFREKRSLQILEERILPELIRARAGLGTPIRIWSAGCASGEEPYSVAIMLNRLLAGVKDPNVEILATDLNARSLQKASAGTYGDWSFRDTPPRVRHAYFEAAEEGRCTVVPAIKKMVRFAQLNLMDDAYSPLANWAGGFDVIFCRNVLMYFTPEGMKKVVQRFYHSLAADGWLIVSASETSSQLFSEFATVSFGDATFYQKSATPLSRAISLPGFGPNGSAVPLPERVEPALEATRISCGEIRREAAGLEVCSQSTAPAAVTYREALGEPGRYQDMEQTMVAPPAEDGDYAPAGLRLARAYANRGELAAALVWCDKAIAADKVAAPAHYLRATILQEQGRLPEALLALRQAVYAEPQFVLGHFTLGNLALKDGRSKESEKHFENALSLLAQCGPEDIVPESEGLSAGRLREVIGLRSGTGRNSRTTPGVGPCL